MARARDMREYQDMVRQALLEVEDLGHAAEFDEMAEIGEMLSVLRHSLQALLGKMEDGTYEFGKDALDFMPLLESHDVDVLPFRYLLQRLNRTHTEGLDHSGEDRAGIEENC